MAREASSNAEIHMHELIRTNDPVLISFVESLMRDAGIGCMVADTNMSILDGSIGMLPSASLDANNKGIYEPCHGSAPDIAGQDLANPLATIMSVAMLLRYSLKAEAAAKAIESAVSSVLDDGLRTRDIMSPGMTEVGCQQMGEAVLAKL